jgi:hypothetical protein
VRITRSAKAERLDDIVELLAGCGRMLQSIDAKLDELVTSLGGDGDDEEDDA